LRVIRCQADTGAGEVSIYVLRFGDPLLPPGFFRPAKPGGGMFKGWPEPEDSLPLKVRPKQMQNNLGSKAGQFITHNMKRKDFPPGKKNVKRTT
jgi:hypothetical protein